MANLAFAPQYNMVAYLEKTDGNAEFHQIVDFLTSSSIHHALTGEGSGSGLGFQETMRGAMAQIRPEGAPIQSSDPLLSTGNTVGSEEDRMEHKIELMDPVHPMIHLSQEVLDLEKVKTAQENEVSSLKKRVTKLKQRQSSRISGRKNLKSQQKFQDIDDLVDEEVIVKNKGSGEKGGNTAETVSTARLDISVARPEVSIDEPKTPSTTTTLFDDEDVTIADTLTKKRDQDQIERDAKVALKIQAVLDEEVRTERERQEEASKAALVGLYDEVQAQIDADHELVDRLTHEEQEKYTVKERKKRVVGSSLKQKSPKKQKVNEQESVDSDKELGICLKVVPDDDKSINYKTLDVKSPILDYESQKLGTMKAGDVHVYKLTRLNGSYRHFLTLSRMLEVLDRQDVLDSHKIVMERFSANDPEEKRYPLTKEILEKMLSWRLEAKIESTLALDLIKFIKLQIEEK
nr:hypothetical protein [Tanacetum cinerariifolium]